MDDLDDSPSEWNEEEVLNHIAADRTERAVAGGTERPKKLIRSSGDRATLTFLSGLFFRARQGDLILMPQKGYTTDVLIGQLLDKPGKLKKVKAFDDDESHIYYGRRVKWVGSIKKRLFNTELVTLLHSQAAFFDIGDNHYEEVYKLAFDNFVYDRQFVATFRTAKNIFTPKDSFLTSVWLELLEVLEEAREDGTKLPDGSIYELVIASDIDENARDDLSISIQSPGWFRIRSNVAAPFASLALFAMAAQGIPYSQAVAATVSAQVVRKADASCMGDVDASVRDYIKLLGKDRWEQACKLAKRADAEAKLGAKAVVAVTPTVRKEGD